MDDVEPVLSDRELAERLILALRELDPEVALSLLDAWPVTSEV